MSFTKELISTVQARLADLGYYTAPINGDPDPLTTTALAQFKARNDLKARPYPGPITLKTLFSDQAIAKPKSTAQPQENVLEAMPPWLAEMNRRMGLHETRDNKALSSWLKAGKFLGNPAKLPWCGDAVETCIIKTLPGEEVPGNPFWAQAWKTFGRAVNDPIVGAIGVIRWSAKAGHVGIVVGYDKRRQRVYLMGGNQQNAVTISSFPLHKFIAFRWPETFPVKRYPAMKATGIESADYGATR